MDGAALADRFLRLAEPMTPLLSHGALQQKVEQDDRKHDEAHERLREEINQLNARFSTLAAVQSEMRVALRDASTPDVSNLRITPGTLVAIVMTVVTLVGGFWTLKDSMSELRKNQQLQELKINELTNKVLDAIRSKQP